MSLDYAALKSEIDNDPAGLGYAAYVAVGNDNALALLLNTPTVTQLTVSVMPKGDLLLALIPAVAALAAHPDAAVVAKWDRYLRLVEASDTIRVSSAPVQALLNAAVADGLMAANYRNTIGKRAATRAEVLFGEGSSVAHDDISYALREMK